MLKKYGYLDNYKLIEKRENTIPPLEVGICIADFFNNKIEEVPMKGVNSDEESYLMCGLSLLIRPCL